MSPETKKKRRWFVVAKVGITQMAVSFISVMAATFIFGERASPVLIAGLSMLCGIGTALIGLLAMMWTL